MSQLLKVMEVKMRGTFGPRPLRSFTFIFQFEVTSIKSFCQSKSRQTLYQFNRMVKLLSLMANSMKKLMLKILSGQFNKDRSMITKVNSSISQSKNGRTKAAGGPLQSKEMPKSTPKRSTLNPPNFQNLKDKPNQPLRK